MLDGAWADRITCEASRTLKNQLVLRPLSYIDKESGTPSYKSVPVNITLRSKEIRAL